MNPRATDTLWAVTSYFNPMRYRRRLDNYRMFRRHLATPLVTVELAYQEQFDLRHDDADILVQISGRDVMWQKERLLNLALAALPADVAPVAWLDCDVLFARDDWPARVGRVLQQVPLVQLFSRVCYLRCDWSTLPAPADAIERTRPSIASGVAAGNAIETCLTHPSPAHRPGTYANGLAWAARRDLLQRRGLFDANIIGGGDRAITCAAYGCFDHEVDYHYLNPRQQEFYRAWAVPFYEECRGAVSVLDETIYHLWHGDVANRGLGGRHADLREVPVRPVCRHRRRRERMLVLEQRQAGAARVRPQLLRFASRGWLTVLVDAPREKARLTGAYRTRALSALKWSVSGAMAVQLIRFGFGIALARLLSPREFGLMAMLTVLTQFVAQIPNLGLEEALIQKRDLDESHRSSVFWGLLVGGVVVAAGFVLCAPWIAAFYETRELTPLAGLVSIALVLRAVGSVPRAIMVRRLNFRISVTLQCAAAAVGGSCAVALAWGGFGATSLAVELIVTSGLESLLLLGASAWRPRLEFRSAALRELLGFGTHRFATRGLNYWAQNIDQLLIGKFLGSDPVGLYVRAYNLVRFPVTQVSRATVRVMFPSLALIQDEPARVRDVYLRATGAVALATFPMCMGLFAAAEPLVVGILGPQWRDTVPLVRILSLAAVVQSITTLAGSLYLAQGRADLQLRVTAVQRLLTIGAIAIGLQFGVLGVAVARVCAAVLNVVPTLYFACRLVNLRMTALLAQAGPVFAAGAAMTAIVVGVDSWAAIRLAELERLGLDVLTGVLVYWLALRLLRVRAYVDVIDLLRRPGTSPV